MKNQSDTNFLDKISFLGLRIWDFALRSLNREYCWFFLLKLVFKYTNRRLPQ